jgi:two-component system sensor histidine kinase BaeS
VTDPYDGERGPDDAGREGDADDWRRPDLSWGPPGPWVRGRGQWGPRGGGPRHRGPAGFFGCLLIGLVGFIAFVTALATWLAGILLGIVAPGNGVSAPTALAVIVVLVLAVLIVSRFLGRTVTPLASIAAAAERLADGEYGVRVTVAGPGQVRRLGASFNAMAERLDRSRSDRQALLADVTHELRTPLTVISGSVEAMLDGVHPLDDTHLAPILAEVAVMNRLLDDLRTVSLAESGALPLHREDVDSRRAEADVVEAHAAAATEAGVSLSAVAGPPIVLDADPVRLREVLANLVVNGVRHTPAGGSVRLDASVDGPWVELTVADTGEGIAPADLERVFDRFHRRAETATGAEGGTERRADTGRSGLGLTIVRDLVAAHGGTVRAESDGIPGHGTTFRVRLPRRD